jgi:DNA invertase Pin-like site-specific DNA recombinase
MEKSTANTMQSNGKTAIYCRVASIHPNDVGTIDLQLNKLRDFAAQQGFEGCVEYLDNGYSGNNLCRPAFAQMEADINLGKIDTIIVSCISRIARDYSLMEDWIAKARAKGIHLIALDGSHDPPPAFLEIASLLKGRKRLTA